VRFVDENQRICGEQRIFQTVVEKYVICNIEKSGISASALGPGAHSEPHQLGPGGLHLLGDPSGQAEGGNLPRLGANDGPATVIAGGVGVLEDLCTFAGASLTKQHTHLQTNRETYSLLLPLHPFTGLFSRTTWVSHYQKGKTSLDSNEARDDGVLECSGTI